jgi:hypothetical protein
MNRPRFVFCLAALLYLGSVSSLHAAITCTPADYNGTYVFFTSGSFVQLPPQAAILQGTFAQAGTFTSDGLGNVTIISTASYNGIVLPANVPGTYTITNDCKITFNLNLPPPLSVPTVFQGVFNSNLRGMSLVITSPPGTVVIGTHAKMDTLFCGVGNFRGSYDMDIGGAVASGSLAGLHRRVGLVVSDGAGNFTATTIANYNGQAVEEDFTGTYSVTGDCGITLAYNAPNGANITIGGYLGGHGDVGAIMVTTQGWAVSGTLKAMQP